MTRALGLQPWCLIGLGVFAGCRAGYDEISIPGNGVTGGAGFGSSTGGLGVGGTGVGGTGVGGSDSGAGEAGVDGTGGTSAQGGTGGASMTGGTGGASGTGGRGGTSTSGGNGGASASGGRGGASASGGSSGISATGGSTGGGGGGASASGGKGGSIGGVGGASGGSVSGAGGGGAGAGAGGGMSGASGAGGSAGGLGQGGYAGASSLGDCQVRTYNANDYVLCNVNVPWATARDNCSSIGTTLVRVEDVAESQWLHDNAYDTPPRQGVWLGGSDSAMEGQWRWIDGALFWLGDNGGSAQNGLYAGWLPTQPSGQPAARDCTAMDLGSGFGWYDLDCATPQPYICEAP